MFGILVAGKLIQTEFQQIDQSHAVFNLTDSDSVNHIVVFLTGTQPFPDGLAGAVYFSWPSADGSIGWQYLGFISNEKPSAIFKIVKPKAETNQMNASGPFCPSLHVSHLAQIGISIENKMQVESQTTVLGAEVSQRETFVEFVQKMLESFANFATSFAVKPTQTVMDPSESYLPVSVVQKWYENFQRRFTTNPNFWRS